MKDRFYTLLFALMAFLLSLFLLMPPKEPVDEVSLPTTEDRGDQGLQGLYRWLETNKIPVRSLRKRFTDLSKEKLSPTGNLLILSMPQQHEALNSEWHALQEWIDRGNAVIVLGAGYFAPSWSDSGDCFCDIDQLLSGFGWSIDSDQDQSSDQSDDEISDISFKKTTDNFIRKMENFLPEQASLMPQSEHTLTQGVTTIQSKITPQLLEQYWYIDSENNSLALRLLGLSEQQHITLMWQLEAGSGQVFLSLAPDLFNNETLNKADNAHFFANILSQSLDENGQVIFDDYHFGLSDLYDPEQFFADSRLHKTLGFIALLWLFYVLGYSNRLAPAHATGKKTSTLDFVGAMAGFFSHRLDNKTLAQALTERLILDIRQHRHLSNDQEAWQWLYQHPNIQDAQLTLLQKAQKKQRTALQGLTNTITEIRKTILI
jgi:hypothetical protein